MVVLNHRGSNKIGGRQPAQAILNRDENNGIKQLFDAACHGLHSLWRRLTRRSFVSLQATS